jgi:hypothetical protein
VKKTKSTIHFKASYFYTLSTSVGMLLFFSFSTISKLLAGSNPFAPKGLLVPLCVGAVIGILSGWSRRRILVLNKMLETRVHDLESLLPICAGCKRIRTTGGNPKLQRSWIQIESYLKQKGSDLTHGICPDCMRKHYPEVDVVDE